MLDLGPLVLLSNSDFPSTARHVGTMPEGYNVGRCRGRGRLRIRLLDQVCLSFATLLRQGMIPKPVAYSGLKKQFFRRQQVKTCGSSAIVLGVMFRIEIAQHVSVLHVLGNDSIQLVMVRRVVRFHYRVSEKKSTPIRLRLVRLSATSQSQMEGGRLRPATEAHLPSLQDP